MRSAILFAIPVVLLAQPAQPVAQDPAKARLEGQVLNSVTNQPVRKARLTLRAHTAYTATSDAMGKFTFANVEPGDYALTIQRDGFAYIAPGARHRIQLAAGDCKSDLLARMSPYGSISGSVLDEDGDPIRNITVSAMTWHYTSGGRELQAICTAISNDLGEYRIFDVPAGRYFLKAGDWRMGSAQEDVVGYGILFYPGFPQVSGAIMQDVSPGAQLRNLNFNLRKARYANLRGRIVAPPNATGVTAGIWQVTDSASNSTFYEVKGKDFQFEYHGIPPGQLYLTADYVLDGQRYSTSLSVDVSESDIEGIELRPLRRMDIAGRIRVAGQSAFPVSQLGLDLSARGQGGANATLQADGTFALRDVAPAVYLVYLYMPASRYLKSIYWGSTEITDTSLDLTNGVPPRTELSIVLGADGGRLQGIVTDENAQPCDGVSVTLLPTGAHRSHEFYKFPTADASGKFTIAGIAPGTYKLLAWDKVDYNAVMYDPDFLAPYESAAQTVEIAANDNKDVDLKLTLNKEP